MALSKAQSALTALALSSLVAATARAEEPPGSVPPVAAPAPSATTAPPPAVPPPPAANTAPPSNVAVPPGYMLVPIPQSNAETRYDVQYPQTRGALPPGMELPYEDGDPVPPGYRLVRQRRRGLIIAGSIVTGVPWVIGVTAATAANFGDNSGLLVLPVVGPWLMLATNDLHGSDKAGERSVLVFDGLLQAAGGAMFFAGMLLPRVRLVRSDVVVSVVPLELGHGAHGIGAIGRF